MGAVKQFMTCAGQLNLVTAKQFVGILLNKNKEDISDAIADVEILGLENDGRPPVIKKCFMEHNEMFTGYADLNINHSMESTWKNEVIKLAVIDKDPETEILNQLEKIIHFRESSDFKNPKKDIDELYSVCEELSTQSLENFGQPDYLIDFGNGKYAVVELENLSIAICVYNKQVRAGIIFEKKTFFGLKVKDMK